MKIRYALASLFSLSVFMGSFWTVLFAQADDYNADHVQIDRYIEKNIAEKNGVMASITDEATFHRRVYLDVIGMIPSAEQTSLFLKNNNPRKRSTLIDDLLKSSQYANYWTSVWSTMLIGRDRQGSGVNQEKFREWLHGALSNNDPYDKMVKGLLTAKGRNDQNGATNFLIHLDLEPLRIIGSVSKLFMGLPLECAQCHDHPTEDWTQRDYYAMAAFFTQVKPEQPTRMMRMEYLKAKNKNEIKGPVPITIEEQSYSKLVMEGTSGPETILPGFIDGRLPKDGEWDYRHAFIDLLMATSSPNFSRNIVNRMWAHFFGRGLVEPLDGIIPSNPASHPRLLEWLADSFVEHQYDMKYLIRIMTNSNAYQRASVPSTGPKDELLYTRAMLRPLTPEQTVFSLLRATGLEEMGKEMNRDQADRIKRGLLHQFAFAFNNDEREETEQFQGTIPQALMMMNGRLVNGGAIAQRGNNLGRILLDTGTHRERIYWIYMTVLSRPPTLEESQYTESLAPGRSGPEAREGYGDLFWALLNSPEFAVNH